MRFLVKQNPIETGVGHTFDLPEVASTHGERNALRQRLARIEASTPVLSEADQRRIDILRAEAAVLKGG